LDRLELVLDRGARVRQVAVLEVVDEDLGLARALQEGRRRRARLARALGRRGEGDPEQLEPGALFDQPQQRPPAADLDVVGVRPERQDPPPAFEERRDVHFAAWTCALAGGMRAGCVAGCVEGASPFGFQTCHETWPRLWM